MWNKLAEIFKDGNDWNEKTIIGFLSFTVMTLTAILDLITGMIGLPLDIHEFVYNSFVLITLGSFGIAGLEKFSPAAKVRAENEVTDTPTSTPTTCPHCGIEL